MIEERALVQGAQPRAGAGEDVATRVEGDPLAVEVEHVGAVEPGDQVVVGVEDGGHALGVVFSPPAAAWPSLKGIIYSSPNRARCIAS